MLKTTYKKNITLLDSGPIPIRLMPNIEQILKKLSLMGKAGRMSTFCISTYSCELHIVTAGLGAFKTTLDQAKKNKFRHVLVVRNPDVITAVLLDNGKEIDRELISPTTLTKDIHARILKQQDGALDSSQAKNLLDMMDGVLFKGVSPHQYKYRVAVSGFGSAQESNAAKNQLNQFGIFIPFSDEVSRLALPFSSSAQSNINEDEEFPDTDMLHIFIRFLAEATTSLDRNELSKIELKFKVKLDQQRSSIRNIKTLIGNQNFNSLLRLFNKEYGEEYSPIEFLVTILFKFNKFNYIKYINKKSIQMATYFIPLELPAAERAALLSTEDVTRLESYRLNHVTGEHVFLKYYKTLKRIAGEYDVYFGFLDQLYCLLMHTSCETLARRIGHCSEDALLDYMETHKEEFTPLDSKTYIFSIKIPDKSFDKEDLVIQERCSICQLHFDADVEKILAIESHEVTVQSAPNNDIPSIPALRDKSSTVFFKFEPGSSGVYHALISSSMEPDSGKIFGENKQFSPAIDKLVYINNFSKSHDNRLISAVAKGNMPQVKTALAEMQSGKLSVDINAKNKDDGNTALHYAAMANASESPETQCEIIILLLQTGANPFITNKNNDTAIDLFEQFTEEAQKNAGIFAAVRDVFKPYIKQQTVIHQWQSVVKSKRLERATTLAISIRQKALEPK